mgnify:CR=1 FL=1
MYNLVNGQNNTKNNVAEDLIKSSCQAGFKGLYRGKKNDTTKTNLLNIVRDGFGTEMDKKYEEIGNVGSPGDSVGKGLHASVAEEFGLVPGIPVSVSTIDAHAGVPGVGVGTSGVLVMVMGTSGCYMLNSDIDDALDSKKKIVHGCLGQVENGIQKGYIGYEAGQSAMGDIFSWLSNMTSKSVNDLAKEAEEIYSDRKIKMKQGKDVQRSPLALDWFNGCRSPYNNGSLLGGIVQLNLSTTSGDLYVSVAEGLACGARQIVLNFENGNVPVNEIVAAGGLPHVAPLLMQIYADALQRPIRVTSTKESGAMGAAIYGAVAGGVFENVEDAVEVMSMPSLENGVVYEPDTSVEVVEYWNDLSERYAKLQELEIGLNEQKSSSSVHKM